jgi:hypothetical protein
MAKDKIIESLEERVQDNTNRSIEALKLANYNEQHSRKHNIRMVNYPEKKGEILRDEFVNFQFLINIVKKIVSDSTFTFWFHIYIAVIEPNFSVFFNLAISPRLR